MQSSLISGYLLMASRMTKPRLPNGLLRTVLGGDCQNLIEALRGETRCNSNFVHS